MMHTHFACTCLAILCFAPLAVAQEPEGKPFVIRWFGQSYFQVQTPGGKRIVFDPHTIINFGRPVVQADIALVSHDHPDHSRTDALENAPATRIFQGLKPAAGGRVQEWNLIDEKVGFIRIRSIGSYHDPFQGMRRGKNAIFVVQAEGLTFCHLGDLGHELSADQVKAIGPIDVLMIPVGGIYTINGEVARGIAKQLKPRRYIFPMHYAVAGFDELLPVDEFLEDQPAVKKIRTSNELTFRVDEKVEAPTIILLEPTASDPAKN
jgi:L-ascorbate metabolism protein UlaG (beta-lactamase superfamily)